MKTIINAGGTIKRVSNKKATMMVDNETWTYCSKKNGKNQKAQRNKVVT